MSYSTIMETPERRIQQPVDIPSIVEKARAGDIIAMAELAEFIGPKILRYYRRRLPDEAEDLTQSSLMDIVQSLPTFVADPESPADAFMRWSFAIARNNLAGQFERITQEGEHLESFEPYREGTLYPGNMNSPTSLWSYDEYPVEQSSEEKSDLETLTFQFQERLKNILSPLELKVTQLRITGQNNKHISEATRISTGAVKQIVSSARHKIEQTLLYPAGFKLLAEYPDYHVLAVAAREGRVEAVKILGSWYSTDEWVKQYQWKRTVVDQSLLNQGYVVLSEQSFHGYREYIILLRPKYRNIVKRSGNRLYIKPKDLDRFRETRLKKINIIGPGPEYKSILSQTSSLSEYRQLCRAAKAGKLPSVKVKNSLWFAKPEDIADYRRLHHHQRKPLSQSQSGREQVESNVIYRRTPIPPEGATTSIKEIIEIGDPEGFKYWFFTEVGYATEQRLPWLFHRKNWQNRQYIEDLDQKLLSNLFAWLDHAQITLSSYEIEVTTLKLQSRENKDIALQLGRSNNVINKTLADIRNRIEKHYIFPSNIKRLSSYTYKNSTTLTNAALKGRLEAVWFLGRWYSTDEMVNNYLSRVSDQ